MATSMEAQTSSTKSKLKDINTKMNIARRFYTDNAMATSMEAQNSSTKSILKDINTKIDIARSILKTCKSKSTKTDDDEFKIHDRVLFYTAVDGDTLKKAIATSPQPEETFKKWVKANKVDRLHSNYNKIRVYLVTKYVSERKIPSLDDILRLFTMDDLLKAGYIFVRLPKTKHSIIMENPEHLSKRMRYLESMLNYRQTGRYIIFVDEIELKNHNGNIDMTAYLIGSSQGIYHIEFHDKPDANNLEDFISDALIYVPSSSVIVVPEKTKSDHKLPNAYSTKSEMSDWLTHNDIPHDKQVHRAELFDLIERVKKTTVTDNNKLDVLILSKGHEVVKRPEGHNMFNFHGLLISDEASMESILKEEDIDIFKQKFVDLIEKLISSAGPDTESRLSRLERTIYEEDNQMESIIDHLMSMAQQSPNFLENRFKIDGKKATGKPSLHKVIIPHNDA